MSAIHANTRPTHSRSDRAADRDLAVALRLATALARRAPVHVRDDARSAALLTWTEHRDRHDPLRGRMSTFAYQRMCGSALDLARVDRYPYHQCARQVISADLVTSSHLTAELALRQALLRAEPTLDAAERAVLELVYVRDLSFAEASQACGRSTDTLERASRRLVERLRRSMHEQQPT